MSFSEDTAIPMPPDGNYWKDRAEKAEAAHMASFSALQRISELTHLQGEVDDYDAVVQAVSMLAEGRIGNLLRAATEEDDMDDTCPTCRAPFDKPHEEGCPEAGDPQQ